MARGPNIDRRQLKEDIFRLCYETVKQDGAAAINARKVAKEIGCSVGSIYNVFENLDAIILEINSKTLQWLEERITNIIENTGDPMEALFGFGSMYIELGRDHYQLWNTLFEHPRKDKTPKPEWYQQKVSNIFALISTTIAPLFDNDLKKADAATKILWAGFHGISALALSGRLENVKAASAPEMVNTLITNFIAGSQTLAAQK